MAVATAAGTVVLGSLVLHVLWKASQVSHVPGPPPSSFLFGHLFDQWGNITEWKTRVHYPEPYLSWLKRYGGAVHLRELNDHTVVFMDPVALQHILIANGTNYPRKAIGRAFVRDVTLGDGLFNVEGKQHDTYRKIMNPLFSVSKIKTFVEIFTKQTMLYCEKFLEPACDSHEPVNLSKVFTQLMLSIVGLAVLGFDFDQSPAAIEAYEQSMVQVSPHNQIGIFTIPGFTSFPIPSMVKRRKAQETLKKMLVDIIHEKLATSSSEMPKDLLDMILPHATTDEAVSHTVTFMLAGHDTTSNTLGFVIGTLASYPDVMAGIRAEHGKVVSKYGSLNSWEAVTELEYTLAVVQETLRLNTMAFAPLFRIADADDTVPMADGTPLFVPKGTTVQINFAAMHRNPKYWTEPESFIPDRFVQGTAAWKADLVLRGGKSHAFYYMPKVCIGQKFALAQVQTVVAILVSKYDFIPTSKMDMRQAYGGITVAPVHVEMTVRRVVPPCA
ncbi:unnamed protein product [Aphanomyces euteiches]